LAVLSTSLTSARLATDKQTDKHRHRLKPSFHFVGQGLINRRECVRYVANTYSMLFSGLLLRFPIWGQPKSRQMFDDSSYWALPDEGFPAIEEHDQRTDKLQSVDNV